MGGDRHLRDRRLIPAGAGRTPPALQKLAEKLFKKRTGRRALPFDVLVGNNEDGDEE